MGESELPQPRSRVIPPLWLLIAIVGAVILHILLPVARLFPAPSNWIGLAPICLGLALAITANAKFKAHGTPVLPTERPTELVASGPYRFTRNPMYLGMVLLLVGLAICLGTLTPWLAPVLFAPWIEHSFIRREEAKMRVLFGEAFDEYCAQVRRWL